MKELIYVLAGSADQAFLYASEMNIDKSTIRYVYDIDRLRGIEGNGKKLILYGTYYERKDHYDIITEAVSRGWEVAP